MTVEEARDYLLNYLNDYAAPKPYHALKLLLAEMTRLNHKLTMKED